MLVIDELVRSASLGEKLVTIGASRGTSAVEITLRIMVVVVLGGPFGLAEPDGVLVPAVCELTQL